MQSRQAPAEARRQRKQAAGNASGARRSRTSSVAKRRQNAADAAREIPKRTTKDGMTDFLNVQQHGARRLNHGHHQRTERQRAQVETAGNEQRKQGHADQKGTTLSRQRKVVVQLDTRQHANKRTLQQRHQKQTTAQARATAQRKDSGEPAEGGERQQQAAHRTTRLRESQMAVRESSPLPSPRFLRSSEPVSVKYWND